MPAWLKDAVFYEIYPQSFYDTNADGIGDFQGIIEKLDYIKGLGCNALWINPCFDSPFKDAGYDVRDYMMAAPRYGTNEDLFRLFREAHARGIHVLLDLVPGHTSEEHKWFLKSGEAERNEYSDRYIWTDHWIKGIPGRPYIGGEFERNGVYMLNFFKCQPALNYGWKEPTEAWQQGIDDPGPRATREAIKEVMRFWLSHGCDGFRVDMAESLVKGDDEKRTGTCAVWRDLFSVKKEFPEAAFVAEWGHPELAITGAGFDMDFYLDHAGNGYNTLMRDYETAGGDHSYFLKDGGGDITRFLDDFLPRYEASKDHGFISFITCNQDTPRPSWTLSDRERKLAFAMIFTMPGVPFLYYGDEIGMRYCEELRTKEGGYTRTGSRTPMQWDESANKGFSTGRAEDLYLPVDSRENAPSAAAQEILKDSLLNTVREILALRHAEPGLQADTSFEVLHAIQGDPLFIYKRGELTIAVNPSGEEKSSPAGILHGSGAEVLFRIGEASCKDDGAVCLGPQSFAILR